MKLIKGVTTVACLGLSISNAEALRVEALEEARELGRVPSQFVQIHRKTCSSKRRSDRWGYTCWDDTGVESWDGVCTRRCPRGYVPSAKPDTCVPGFFRRPTVEKDSDGSCPSGTEKRHNKCMGGCNNTLYEVMGTKCKNMFWSKFRMRERLFYRSVKKSSFLGKILFAELTGSTTYGVGATLGPYDPSEPTEYHPQGSVLVDKSEHFSFVLKNLEPNVIGGVHIHSGTECGDASGGHFWRANSTDPWKTITYSSNEFGHAMARMRLPTNAFGFHKNIGKVVVVHAADGSRVACGKLSEFVGNALEHYNKQIVLQDNFENTHLPVVLSRYPGLSQDTPLVKGNVLLSRDNRFIFALSNLESESEGGIHIHKGLSCEESGPHYFTSNTDPWTEVKWKSNQQGNAKGMIDLKLDSGYYGFSSNVNHAVVVHNSSGARVACGIIRPQFHYGYTAKIGAYPGVPEGVNIPAGKASLTQDNMFRFSVRNMVPNTKVFAHIHEGVSCEQAGGHHWNASQTKTDFWNAGPTVTADQDGNAMGGLDVSRQEGGFPFSENILHAVVIHNNNGTRVGCGTLTLFEYIY